MAEAFVGKTTKLSTTSKGLLSKKLAEYVTLASEKRTKSMFSLGPLSVNLAIGNPDGVPSGRVVQVVGPQSSGKSTLAFEIVRSRQEQAPEENILYVDFERSFDLSYALACGVDPGRLWIVRAPSTEVGLSIVEEAIQDLGIKLVVIDSIAAAVPSSEHDKSYQDAPKVASNAGLITRFCARIVPLLDDKDALLVVLNQLRANFNTMSHEKQIPFGGAALQYATSVTLSLANVKKEDTRQTIQVFVKKNKVGAPQARAEFMISYGQGINLAADVIELGVIHGIISKNGSWYTYGEHKAQGALAAASQFPIEQIKHAVIQAVFASSISEE